MRFLSVIVGLGLVIALGPLALGEDAQVSPVIIPVQQIPLRFSHVEHMSKVDADCDDCHEDIDESASALDNNIPNEETCAMCHDIDRQDVNKVSKTGSAPAACSACHEGFQPNAEVKRVRIPPPNLKFSHKAHLARGTSCQTCHGDFVAERVGLATRDQLPTMQVCLDCHDGRKAASTCQTCHLSAAGRVIKTQFPGSGKLVPSGTMRGAAHDMNFRGSHQQVAKNDPDYCASCHKKDFCAECHNGIIKPMDFHVGDYVSMHPIDARRQSSDCSSCHRQQTFCVGCHSRLGVTSDGKGSEFDSEGQGVRFHPEGWADFSRGATHHSFEAQRNLKQCTSCHREDFCVRCHSAQPSSLRVNPHPRDWIGSRRCRALVARAGRMCLRCHVRLEEVDCDRPF